MKDVLQQDLFVPTAMCILVTCVALAWFALAKKRSESKGTGPEFDSERPSIPCGSPSDASSEDEEDVGARRRQTIHGTLIPSNGLVIANGPKSLPVENSLCKGHFLAMHKPTTNADMMASGGYPYGDHLHGRRRLWEARFQLQFKQAVDKSMLFGIELDNYVPLNAAASRLMGMTVAMLQQVVGNDLYHSVGDDPANTPAPHEKPVFMMPLWAFDQVVITPEGETPPDLTDPHFSNYGIIRANDRKAFVQEMSQLQLVPGPTYTFAFWGISQFLDCVKWELTKVIPFKSIDFNQFCGAPPVHMVMYTLDMKNAPEGDKRHLESRKNYYFRFALWSTDHKPPRNRLRELIPKAGDLGSRRRNRAQLEHAGGPGYFERLFSCCASERSD